MRAGLALGCNAGKDLLPQMRIARDMLKAFHKGDLSTFKQSFLYKTKPLDCPPESPDFYNAVIELEWDDKDAGGKLLQLIGDIEYFFGREVRVIRNAPRPMDVDILYMEGVAINTDALVIPHPRIMERAFVLQPLMDILHDQPIPGIGQSAPELLQRLNADPSDVVLVSKDW